MSIVPIDDTTFQNNYEEYINGYLIINKSFAQNKLVVDVNNPNQLEIKNIDCPSQSISESAVVCSVLIHIIKNKEIKTNGSQLASNISDLLSITPKIIDNDGKVIYTAPPASFKVINEEILLKTNRHILLAPNQEMRKIIVSNFGNKPANLKITLDSKDLSLLNDTCSNKKLDVYPSQCSYTIKLKDGVKTSGTAVVKISSSGEAASTTTNVDYIVNPDIMSMSAIPYPDNELKTKIDDSAYRNLVITNNSNIDITALQLKDLHGLKYTDVEQCLIKGLLAHKKCNILITYIPNAIEKKDVDIIVTANYFDNNKSPQTYDTSAKFALESYKKTAILTITSESGNNFIVNSDGQDYMEKNFIIKNIGSEPAKNFNILNMQPLGFSISKNTCESSIAESSSCIIGLKYGPVLNEVAESSTNLTINYIASTSDDMISISQKLLYQTIKTKQAILTITPVGGNDFNIIADNIKHEEKDFIINNIGNDMANNVNVSSIQVAGFNISKNTCESSIAKSSSCIIGLKYGPVSTAIAKNSTTLTINYLASIGSSGSSISKELVYQANLVVKKANLYVSEVAPIGDILGGDGWFNPFLAQTTGAVSFQLTYTNNGDGIANSLRVIQPQIPFYTINNNCDGKNLYPGGTCTITYILDTKDSFTQRDFNLPSFEYKEEQSSQIVKIIPTWGTIIPVYTVKVQLTEPSFGFSIPRQNMKTNSHAVLGFNVQGSIKAPVNVGFIIDKPGLTVLILTGGDKTSCHFDAQHTSCVIKVDNSEITGEFNLMAYIVRSGSGHGVGAIPIVVSH